MDKQKFNSLPLNKQIIEFNKLLKESSIRQVCKKIGIPKTTVRDRFAKRGYLFNPEKNQYINENEKINNDMVANIKDEDKKIDVDSSNITFSNIEESMASKDITNSNITDNKEPEIAKEVDIKTNITFSNIEVAMTREDITESNITEVNSKILYKMYDELKDMLTMKEDLRELIEAKRREEKIIEVPELVLHEFKEKPIVKTLKIYGDVITMLENFMKGHKNFTQQEVVSQALYEFLNKYK